MNHSLSKQDDADHWEYVGEGNLNLVVRYIGDNQIYVSFLFFLYFCSIINFLIYKKGKVLRVIKNSENKQCPNQDTMAFQKQFSEKVIQSLLGKEYVVLMVKTKKKVVVTYLFIPLQSPVSTSIAFLQRLAAQVEPFRPAFRTDKQIIVESPVSFLLNDLTQVWPNSPTMTFELKVIPICVKGLNADIFAIAKVGI